MAISDARPTRLRDVIGQRDACEEIESMVKAAKRKGKLARHVALTGPAGCGKTTLARAIAWELDAPINETIGGAVNSITDMANKLAELDDGTILFIDEFDGVFKSVRRQVLYTAMTDGVVHIKGKDARTIKVQPFTLVVATTEGKFEPAMRRRFQKIAVDYYPVADLTKIITWSAEHELYAIEEAAARYLAERSLGVAGTAQELLDYATDKAPGDVITLEHAVAAMRTAKIDDLGLDRDVRKILLAIAEESLVRPIGLGSIAAVVGGRDVSEEVSLLRRLKLVKGTDNGQIVTSAGWRHAFPASPIPAIVQGREAKQV